MRVDIRGRGKLWREIAWRPALALTAIPWALMGAYNLLKSEFMPMGLQEKWQLRNLIRLPWWAWALASLFILAFVILESAYRVMRKREAEINKRDVALEAETKAAREATQKSEQLENRLHIVQSELETTKRELADRDKDRELATLTPPEKQSKVRLQARGITHIQYDHNTKMYTHLFDGTASGFSIVIQILNLAVRGASNKPVRVRAQAMYKRDGETTLLSPLVWLESPTSDCVLGPGEIRELVIARRDSYGFWDFLTHGQHGNVTPSDGLDFDFEIDLIDLETGKILEVEPPLYFHWHWREGPLTPSFQPITPPEKEKRN